MEAVSRVRVEFTQVAVGQSEFTGHVLYALADDGTLWRYTPAYVSPAGYTRGDMWSQVPGPMVSAR